jgi:hypothetical protein
MEGNSVLTKVEVKSVLDAGTLLTKFDDARMRDPLCPGLGSDPKERASCSICPADLFAKFVSETVLRRRLLPVELMKYDEAEDNKLQNTSTSPIRTDLRMSLSSNFSDWLSSRANVMFNGIGFTRATKVHAKELSQTLTVIVCKPTGKVKLMVESET